MLCIILLRKNLLTVLTCALLLGCSPAVNAQRPEPQPTLSVLAGVSGGISYTGLNTYVTLSGAYKRHMFYIGPKAVVSKSFVSGKMLWGGNLGYNFAVIDQERWITWVNLDYQYTTYRLPASIKYNTIHEITGGLSLNYFAIPQKLAVGITLGTGIFHENFYSRYGGVKGNNSGMMQQIRLGLIYKISRQ